MRDASDALAPLLYNSKSAAPTFVMGFCNSYDPATRTASVSVAGAGAIAVKVMPAAADGLTDGDTVAMLRVGPTLIVIGVVPADGPAPSGTARYRATATQSIPNNTYTRIQFGTVDASTALMTRVTQSSGAVFTFQRDGLWSLSANVRFAGNATGERYMELVDLDGTPLSGFGCAASNTSAFTAHASITRYFAAGEGAQVFTYQNSGAALALTLGPGWTQFNAAWLRY